MAIATKALALDETLQNVVSELQRITGASVTADLKDLHDVDTSNLQDGQLLQYNASNQKWESVTVNIEPSILYAGSQVIYSDWTSAKTKTGFFTGNKSSLLGSVELACPTGYKTKIKISAILNTADNNIAEVYINSVKVCQANTWIGSGGGSFKYHYGKIIISDLLDLDDIAKEARYIQGGSADYYNFYLKSSNTSYDAFMQFVTLHYYYDKIIS